MDDPSVFHCEVIWLRVNEGPLRSLSTPKARMALSYSAPISAVMMLAEATCRTCRTPKICLSCIDFSVGYSIIGIRHQHGHSDTAHVSSLNDA